MCVCVSVCVWGGGGGRGRGCNGSIIKCTALSCNSAGYLSHT